MHSNGRLYSVGRAVDVMLAEASALKTRGPHFRIIHRFADPETPGLCVAGEQVVGVFLYHRGHEFQVPLSTSLLLLFDYLAKHRRLPMSAKSIVAGMASDPFCRKHGLRGLSGLLTRRISRRSVKVYIGRIRAALAEAFREAGLTTDPALVLVAEETTSNEVAYRLRATVDVAHVTQPTKRDGPRRPSYPQHSISRSSETWL